MKKGQGKGTDTSTMDNDYLRRGDVKRLLENAVCLHDGLPAQIDLIPAADVVVRDCYDRLLAENDELRKERPVVRCGECEFWERDRISCEGMARCRTGESGVRFRAKHDYCSRGILKGKDGDGDV